MPSWWDRFGQEWASQGLTDDPTFAQGDAGWAFIGQAPPTVEQFNSMFQWNDDKDNWLYGQVANCIIGSGEVPSSSDLMQLWNAIKSLQRRKLTAATAFYVDAINGNDVTGTGGQATPWRTIQYAVQFIYDNIDVGGQNAIIQLAPGNYGPVYCYQPVNGNLIIQGDPLNPRAYVIKNTNGTAIVAVASAVLFVTGIAVEAVGTIADYETFGNGMHADRSAVIIFDQVACGPCTYAQFYVGAGGHIWPWYGASTSYSIYGGGWIHGHAASGGIITTVKNDITITGNPTFSTSYFYATHGGFVQCWEQVVIGTCVGKRYAVDWGGMLNAGGQANTIIPGTIAGTVSAATYGMLA